MLAWYCTADLLAEVGVISVASEINARTSHSGSPLRISWVSNREVYQGGRTASSDQILRARIFKNVEKIDPSRLRKYYERGRKARAAGVAPRCGGVYPTMVFS